MRGERPEALPQLPWGIRRALQRGGYRTRTAVARASDAELLALHGMGPVRLAQLRRLIPYEAAP